MPLFCDLFDREPFCSALRFPQLAEKGEGERKEKAAACGSESVAPVALLGPLPSRVQSGGDSFQRVSFVQCAPKGLRPVNVPTRQTAPAPFRPTHIDLAS